MPKKLLSCGSWLKVAAASPGDLRRALRSAQLLSAAWHGRMAVSMVCGGGLEVSRICGGFLGFCRVSRILQGFLDGDLWAL